MQTSTEVSPSSPFNPPDDSNNATLIASPKRVHNSSPITEQPLQPPSDTKDTHTPLESIFTTGDSDDDDKSENSSGGEEQNDPTEEIKFTAFERARAKKKLNFNDVSKQPRKITKQKREDPMSIHSETQRMVRESKVKIPEYEPPVISLQDVIRKLPKLTKPVAKPEMYETGLVPNVPSSMHTTSTPLPKSGLAETERNNLEDLPDIEFITEQPIDRMELTVAVEKVPQVKQSNQPVLSLPTDFTNMNLATDSNSPVSSLQAFKSRFIHHSLPPTKHRGPTPLSADSEESQESLLPPILPQKPGGVHAFLREKLRKSLIAKRVQEHENLQLKIRYENEEYFPSEGSGSEAEDVERREVASSVGEGEIDQQVDGGWCPEGGDEVSHSEDNDDSSSESESESESGSESDTSGSEDSDVDCSDSEREGDLRKPKHKAKRQVLDNSDNDDDLGDEPAVVPDIPADSQPIHFDSPPKLVSQQSNEILSQSLEQLMEVPQDESALNFSTSLFPFSCHNTDAQECFKLPLAYQLPSQSYIPEDLMRICDATQEGDNQLEFMCSAAFTQVTQSENLMNEEDPPDTVVTDSNSKLDDTLDTELPMLAPRKMKVKDQKRLQRYRQLAAFEEKEAELSGSDAELEGSECGSEFGEELDEYESEEGDLDAVEREEVERLNAKYYNEIMIEDDEANMELLKERFLPEQEIVEDGLRMKNGLFRKRKFNFEDDDMSTSGVCDWDEEARDQEVDQVTQERRRRRVEREDYLFRKSASTLSDLAYSDTRTIPLVDKPSFTPSVSCDQKITRAVPSIRTSLGKHNSLLSRNFSAKLDSNFATDSNSEASSNLVGRKAFVFQTIRSLDGTDTNSVPPLTKSVSLPPPVSRKGLQTDLKKEVSFLKPGTSVFHLLNVN